MTQSIFRDLPGVKMDIDDILIWGRNLKQHDKRLEAVLKRCIGIHLTLNKEKCKFIRIEVTYIGHKLMPQGIHADPKKLRLYIMEMPAPSDKKGVER